MTVASKPDIGPAFDAFVQAVHRDVDSLGGDEHAVTQAVAGHLQEWLSAGVELPEPWRRPNPDHYVMYPLYVAEDGSFCIASAVWDVGQGTPVHDHGTWGVIGIVSGLEQERRFMPDGREPNGLRFLEENALQPGEVEICCTTDQDVHAVAAGSDVPCVGIHVYGANIGTLPRNSYNVADGSRKIFTSTWAQPIP